jgi:hypothetical protein
MKTLPLRTHADNRGSGLGPFFGVQPLGLEYSAAPLTARANNVTIADLSFSPGPEARVVGTHPELVGISCLHQSSEPAKEDLFMGRCMRGGGR